MPARRAVTETATCQIRGVAEILAATDPGAWQQLLVKHVPDDSGHCRACYSSSGASPVWPCRLRGIADEAKRITDSSR